jgi:hypothetical protein
VVLQALTSTLGEGPEPGTTVAFDGRHAAQEASPARRLQIAVSKLPGRPWSSHERSRAVMVVLDPPDMYDALFEAKSDKQSPAGRE